MASANPSTPTTPAFVAAVLLVWALAGDEDTARDRPADRRPRRYTR